MTIEPIKQKLNIQDALYYEDLIYYLKKEAGLDYEPNEETEKRIGARFDEIEQSVQVPGSDYCIAEQSIFQIDIFSIAMKITKITGARKFGLRIINKCPEEVKKEIQELETKVANLKAKNPKLELHK